MKTDHKVSFVIASRNENPATVDATVQGLLATSYYGNWREVIVVDDCSDTPYTYYHPEVVVLRNPEPLGACRSRRRGCSAAAGDVVVGLDAHMSFAPGWLEEMLKYVDSGALLTPPWMNYRQTETYHWGCEFGWHSERDWSKQKFVGLQPHGLFEPKPMEPVMDVPMVIGACYMMRKDAYDAIGGWNPHFSIYGSEEQDISARAWLFGNGVKCVTGARVGHLDRDKINKTPFQIEWSYFEQNQAVMIRSLFEKETTEILEDYLHPMLPEVKAALDKADIAGWREFLQAKRKMSDAEFFRRFLGDESPITYKGRKPSLKKREMPPGIVHRAVQAEEDKIWNRKEHYKSGGKPSRRKVALPREPQEGDVLKQKNLLEVNEEITQQDWKGSVAVDAYGVTIGFRVTNNAALKKVAEGLAHHWKVVCVGEVDLLYSVVGFQGCWRLFAGASYVAEAKTLAELPALVSGSLRYELIDRVHWQLMVDAAVVSWKGHAVMLLGDRWSGRAALQLEMLRLGAKYCSQAYGVVDMTTHLVQPFAQPVSFLGDEGKVAREWPSNHFDCEDKPLPLGLVVDLRLRPGAELELEQFTRAGRVRRLFGEALNGRHYKEHSFNVLKYISEDALALKGQRAGAAEAAEALLRQLDVWLANLGGQS